MFWERETKIRGYLAVFLRELAHLVGDFRSDDLRNGFAVDYGGHLIGEGLRGFYYSYHLANCGYDLLLYVYYNFYSTNHITHAHARVKNNT